MKELTDMMQFKGKMNSTSFFIARITNNPCLPNSMVNNSISRIPIIFIYSS